VCENFSDGGSYTSISSMTLINELQVSTKVHPTPHTLQWIEEGSNISKQALILVLVSPYYKKALLMFFPWMLVIFFLVDLGCLIII